MLEFEIFNVFHLILLTFLIVVNSITTTTTRSSQTTILRGTNAQSIFLQRQKRFLLFEKGAALMLQANIAKAIISERPRGLNEITEFTLTYDLPYSVEKGLAPKATTSRTVATPTTKPSAAPTAALSWRGTWQPPVAFHDASHLTVAQRVWHQHKFQQQQQEHKQPSFLKQPQHFPKRPQCHKMAAFVGGMWRAQPQTLRCKPKLLPHSRRGRATPAAELAHLLYDLIELWSLSHNFNVRHCVMRTLCEAQHLLMPAGHALLHDLLRILLNFALPIARRDAAYSRSLRRAHLQDCVLLYGPHCPASFLAHLNQIAWSSRWTAQ